MNNKLKLLLRITNEKINALGEVERIGLNCGFNDLYTYMDMESEDKFIDFIKELGRGKFIEMDLHGRDDIRKSIIKVGNAGIEYLREHDKESKIGFLK